ncbi:MAG: hypothetical protein Q7R31_00185 [Candidatus Levybacteria bacterium]|nr:hypothetical protein [Candidatus Levybacteria bacterium]
MSNIEKGQIPTYRFCFRHPTLQETTMLIYSQKENPDSSIEAVWFDRHKKTRTPAIKVSLVPFSKKGREGALQELAESIEGADEVTVRMASPITEKPTSKPPLVSLTTDLADNVIRAELDLRKLTKDEKEQMIRNQIFASSRDIIITNGDHHVYTISAIGLEDFRHATPYDRECFIQKVLNGAQTLIIQGRGMPQDNPLSRE